MTSLPINSIENCLAQARDLNIRHPLRSAFSHLTGDETTGLVAYAIWRGRSQLLSTLSRASDYSQSGACKSGVSRARSRWHEESAAYDDLPHHRRLGR
jgi:hypothetical protein